MDAEIDLIVLFDGVGVSVLQNHRGQIYFSFVPFVWAAQYFTIPSLGTIVWILAVGLFEKHTIAGC